MNEYAEGQRFRKMPNGTYEERDLTPCERQDETDAMNAAAASLTPLEQNSIEGVGLIFGAYKKKREMNTSGIRPMEYNVLVKPDAVESTTKGGIIIPESKKEKDGFARTEGTLVAISPMSFMNSDWPVGMDHLKPTIGCRVVFSRYQATQVKGKDGDDYWLMKDASIAGIME